MQIAAEAQQFSTALTPRSPDGVGAVANDASVDRSAAGGSALVPPVGQSERSAGSSKKPADNKSQDALQSKQQRQKDNEAEAERLIEEQDQAVIDQLKARDREVRAHEQAHAIVGGQYAGAPTYTYQMAPDGRRYAVGGEVSIDTSEIPNDPEATLQKAQLIRAAALAPAEPSGQDQRVAAQATQMAANARVEIAVQGREQNQSDDDDSQAVESTEEKKPAAEALPNAEDANNSSADQADVDASPTVNSSNADSSADSEDSEAGDDSGESTRSSGSASDRFVEVYRSFSQQQFDAQALGALTGDRSVGGLLNQFA